MPLRPPNCLLVTLVALVVAPASGAESPFRLERTREAALLTAGGTLAIGSLILTSAVTPLTQQEIATLDPGDINSFDRESIEPYRAIHAGDALAYTSYLFPLTAFARADTRRDWETIGVMWVEATALNLGINSVTKAIVLRTRPYVYEAETPIEKKTSTSARLSFYSGHTASAACNSYFVARVLSAYVENPKARFALWTGAAVYPALTGLLRVDSGHHFRTDIITGYALGAAIGYWVPHLHRITGDGVSLGTAIIDGEMGLTLRVSF